MDMNLFLRMKEIVWIEKEKNIYDFCKRTNIFHVLELILMRMPMQGIKFRDFMSVYVLQTGVVVQQGQS